MSKKEKKLNLSEKSVNSPSIGLTLALEFFPLTSVDS